MADEHTTKALKDLNLEDPILQFLQESITLDIIINLSIDKFRKIVLERYYETKIEMYCVMELLSIESSWKWGT